MFFTGVTICRDPHFPAAHTGGTKVQKGQLGRFYFQFLTGFLIWIRSIFSDIEETRFANATHKKLLQSQPLALSHSPKSNAATD